MQKDTDPLELLFEKCEERQSRLRYPPCNLPPRKWSISLTLLGDDANDDRAWIEFVFEDEREANAAYDDLSTFEYPAEGVLVKALWSPESEDGYSCLETEGVVLPAQVVQ